MQNSELIVRLTAPSGMLAEVRGNVEVVNQLVGPYLKEQGFTLNGNTGKGTSMFCENVDAPAINQGSQIPHDLVQLYQKAAPDGQYEEVVLIAYHLKNNRGLSDWSLPEVEESYRELLRVPVKPPKDLSGAVRNTTTRTTWVRRTGKNRFTITLQGEAHIREMLHR